MPTRDVLKNRYLDELDDLVTRGSQLCISTSTQYRSSRDALRNLRQLRSTISHSTDYQAYTKWLTDCQLVVDTLLQGNPLLHNIGSCFRSAEVDPRYVQRGLGVLTSIRDSLCAGILDDLEWSIATGVSGDYLDLAKQLLEEGRTDKFDHIPAAVLAGAVLERHLQALCRRQNPPVPCSGDSGKKLTLNPLIENLRNAGVFNEVKAKHLRAWADIRNRAAHGEFDAFSKEDVVLMVTGIGNFLVEGETTPIPSNGG